jgi:hypothetical protein
MSDFMKKLEVIEAIDDEIGKISVLSVDGEVFDWGLDLESFEQARKNILNHQELAESVALSIINHFLESFSDFLGRTVTLQELNEAIVKGNIE